ncbi:type II toxin-antitoxin system VapC family toxin [Rhizobium sp. 9140]|uniref:type II toxin-antitoxin system VapC family toxin n=1 Tax=Rhizobium sp. 9140 TaxID=1761900 RepID=UPI000797B0BD|nr:type II toxin-antitoxin system VapC family toxin [Rhizobium sp. 9140]CZT34462.1 hypothetical protein GA0004734_00014810 [Rhizobium sp. 9140]
MIILDTNVVSEPLRKMPSERVLSWLDAQPAARLYLTTITVAEIFAGMAIMPAGRRKDTLRTSLEHLVTTIFRDRILSFDMQAAREFAIISQKARESGTAIGLADAQIAAIAVATGFSVATRDVTPFAASGLNVINPWTV